jgi:hypothetical protein
VLHLEAPALPTDIRLGWNGLPGGKHSSLFFFFVRDGEKSFVTLVSDVNISKPFYSLTMAGNNKLDRLYLASLSGIVNICG